MVSYVIFLSLCSNPFQYPQVAAAVGPNYYYFQEILGCIDLTEYRILASVSVLNLEGPLHIRSRIKENIFFNLAREILPSIPKHQLKYVKKMCQVFYSIIFSFVSYEKKIWRFFFGGVPSLVDSAEQLFGRIFAPLYLR